MTFSNRQTRAPIPYDPVIGAEAVAITGVTGPLASLIGGAAGCSPYLAGLIAREVEWILPALEAPEAALEDVLGSVAELPLVDLASGLRRAKRRVALLSALADLGGVWTLEQVTTALSRLADAACDVALRRLVAAEVARGKLIGFSRDGMADYGGMVVLSMGKGGAYELNYSSDIDLIVLFDETGYAADMVPEARAVLVRITRKMVSLLNDVTAEGYVFRTDLRLRPDASVTPVCLSMGAAEAYYESVGRTWERAAYIKARAAAGDIAAGEAFLARMRPFVWRKHLDFAAIEDAHDMRLRIRDYKGLGGALDLAGHNIKLGQGGIREIEFFTQTRQLIAGGRDPSLRLRGTVPGLAALQAAGWVSAEVAQGLTWRYQSHRMIEHRLQMIADAQTHDLPKTDAGFDRLAHFMGTDASTLKASLISDLESVHRWTDDFFAPDAPDDTAANTAQDPNFGAEVTARWLDYPALRSDRAATIFKRLSPDILARLSRAAKPDDALANFDRFLCSLPAGVQLFSLFEANPQLTDLMIEICATSPALSDHLSRNSAVFDAVIGGSFFSPWPGFGGLTTDLSTTLLETADYEAKLDQARRWTKEWHFRIGVHHLQGLITAEDAGRQYADLAGAVIAALWTVVQDQFAVKHGPPPGRGAVITAMGSLGVGRLNAASDLDLLVIYDGADADASTGPRPLSTRPYYARLTQAMITALTAPMSQGRLYEVDMRLRPSGRQGPVATSLVGFEDYQKTQAWTWEHLALTRARVVAGPQDLAADVEAVRVAVLDAKSSGDTVLADVAEMRARIAQARPGAGGLDAKSGAGRLQEVELAAQTLALRAGASARLLRDQVAAGVAAGSISDAQGRALLHASSLLWQVQAGMRLLTGAGTANVQDLAEGGVRFMLRETGANTMETLIEQMDEAAEQASDVFDALLAAQE